MSTHSQQAPDVRERILRTASELFYREGTRAVGVDLVVAQSGVAKTSLYRHFPTKDDLIREFLLREDEDFWRKWDEVSAAHPRSAEQELFAQLQWLGDRIARPGYRGCPQINIAAEYSDDNHPARKVAVAHKAEMRARLKRLAKAMELKDPETFSLAMGVIVDGALSSGTALHHKGPARFLQSLARTLIAAQR
ncbi:TetR/AcrR family transcriptional regulator [Dyella mobilis]|uniref:TetR/AcrR family transcriptional regulator n=1 Tax=Dyella mobilis TaxID=1849582 RepID=A0ABS2KFI4_9GAMM|nr:TetR/AcrR family transcriptional regulator [Dyella mobilis]MBM7129933.1 TetR/AcrR family transcriptional regulator [Dyella mobilis]GLQ97804.1 TetR family transcriptional regulator [Dyella mobilis]